jgi:hypothetical protein
MIRYEETFVKEHKLDNRDEDMVMILEELTHSLSKST